MQVPPLITGPIPPFSNPPIQPQFYVPNFFYISSITLGTTTLITTTVNHNYVLGQQCRLLIQIFNGTRELNDQTGFVIQIPNPNQVILNIFSLNFTPFKSSTGVTQSQIVAMGDINSGSINIGRTGNSTLIPGSFQDVSPAPFS